MLPSGSDHDSDREAVSGFREIGMSYHKLFDFQSENYAKSRPHYPKEIYAYVASVCNENSIAWDGACGNGQAAEGLVQYFERVEATDISEQQIAKAIQIPRVTYSVQASENTNFSDNYFDVMCIAQALHWFDYKLFWPEVKRVLKPAGIIAAWGYSWFSIENAIDEIIAEKILKFIKPYWAPQNKLLWNNYREVPFPFERLDAPQIEMKMNWSINELFAYLQSWSAVRLCIEKNGSAFIDDAFDAIKIEWVEESQNKTVKMDFCLLVGRNET